MKRRVHVVPLMIAGCAALVLLLGPLRAQDSAEQEPPAAESAPREAAPPASDDAPETAADEGLSADNSLSFPVDI